MFDLGWVTEVKPLPLLKGLMTFIPGLTRLLPPGSSGGSTTAEYCYGVWLKHATLLANGQPWPRYRTIVELGPGDTLGFGLCGLLSGANHLIALDAIKYADRETNLRVFDTLVELFRARAGRPTRGWPDFDEWVDERLFPSGVFTDELLETTLDAARVERVRAALIDAEANDHRDVSIQYIAPWEDRTLRLKADLVISHVVLEYVHDVDWLCSTLNGWLDAGGCMSHQIDLGSHGLTKSWNGHWSFPPWLWRAIIGNRASGKNINRLPCSSYLEGLNRHGFDVVRVLHNTRPRRTALPAAFERKNCFSNHDMHCSEIFVQARKL